MILQDIINNLQWTEFGVICSNPQSAKLVHKFLREAVLDRHIYINKVIGYHIMSGTSIRSYANKTISRHKQIGESYPEIVVLMKDKVFLSDVKESITTLKTGLNRMSTNTWTDVDGVLFTDDTICRCLNGECRFKVTLQYDCGFRSMAQNSNVLDGKFFPCFTDYSLQEYVRVLPMQPGTTTVPIRYYNGMTVDTFKSILSKWAEYIQQHGLKKEEQEWMQNFEH